MFLFAIADVRWNVTLNRTTCARDFVHVDIGLRDLKIIKAYILPISTFLLY